MLAILYTYPALVQPTWYTLWAVPKVAFQCGAFSVETIKAWRLETEYVVPDEHQFRAAMLCASNKEVASALRVKIGVEFDRSVLGQGKLLLFMPPRSAWNKFEVFAAMSSSGDDDLTGLELELSTYEFLSDRLKYSVLYTICRQGDKASDPFLISHEMLMLN